MRNKLLLETIRTIRLSLGKYLTLLLIVFMGVSFFSGMLSISAAMSESVDAYIDEYNFSDFQIYANYGLDDDDISAINSIDENISAEGAKFIDAEGTFGETNYVFRVESFSENSNINKVNLIEGRYPTAPNEALAEVHGGLYDVPQIGDVVTIKKATGELDEILAETEFTIVGVVTTPNYMSQEKGSSTHNNLMLNTFIYVPEDAFLTDFYTVAYVLSAEAIPLNSFSDEYKSMLADDEDSIEELAQTQELMRAEKIISEANDEYQSGLDEYNDAVLEFEAEMAQSDEDIKNGFSDIEKAENDLNEAKATLDNSISQINSLIDSGAASPQILAQKSLLDTEINNLNSELEKLQNSRVELEEAQIELVDARTEAETEFDEAWDELIIAKEEIDAMGIGEWTILDRDMHYSMSTYADTVTQMQVIGLIFPVFFFMVSALVCLTTMTRMIDEQRGQVGVLRALGYSRFACAGKYLIYSLSATLIGGLSGAILGILIFPEIVYTTWGIMYNLPPINYDFPIFNMIIAIAIFLLLMGLTTYSAIRIETSEVASSLLRPKAPTAGKKVFLEKITFIWNKLSFTSKVTARNIIRYKKRFFMTIFGIAGCTCLLVSGFGMRDSISGIASLQYGELTLYTGVASISEDASATQASEAQKNINALSSDVSSVLMANYSSNVTFGDSDAVAYIAVYDSNDELQQMNLTRTRGSEETYSLDENTVLLSEKLAQLLGVKISEEITIESQDETKATVTVGGIFEKYINHEIYMSSANYESLFGEEATKNSIQIKTDLNEDILQDKVLAMDFVSGITLNSSITSSFDNITTSMNIVVVVIIVSAAILAFVVLGNLASINIGERKREIATLKVLGFNHKETKDYIFKENMVLTIFGAIFGVVLGIFAHNFIITQVEMDFIMFIRLVSIESMLFSVILTFIFSIFVNRFMLSKLKKIDMIESLKSVE